MKLGSLPIRECNNEGISITLSEVTLCKLNPYCSDCSICPYKVACPHVVSWSQVINECKREAAETTSNAIIVKESGLVSTTILESKQYLTDAFDFDKIKQLPWGSAIMVYTQTGSGKSWVVQNLITDLPEDYEAVISLSPRLCNNLQLEKELSEKEHIPIDKLKELQKRMKVTVTTYQSFVRRKNEFKNKKLIVICDEAHCLSEDATFSSYPQQFMRWLKNNLDNTIRIYLTGTPDDITPMLFELEFEPKMGSFYQPLTAKGILNASSKDIATHNLAQHTRIKHLYLMKSDWSHITFKTYDPSNQQRLADYINNNSANGYKTLMLINDIDKGREFNDLLNPHGQQIYSDNMNDELNKEIEEITMNSHFDSSVLITTKVANNGLSIHDDAVTTIVAQSYDPIAIQQIIGRVRVNRKNPRNITVLVPDYNSGALGHIEHMLCEQLKDFKAAKANPYVYDHEPYTYPSPKRRELVANELAIKTLDIKLKFIQALKTEEQENPHAFVRFILSLYGKESAYSDEMRIDYDNKVECRKRLKTALEEYAEDKDMTLLRQKVVSACNETGAYNKELKGNITVDTINKVFAHLGIPERLGSKHEIYDVIVPE